jgi:hypothetical protein
MLASFLEQIMRLLLLLSLVIAGCETKNYTVKKPNSIPLYPGYVVKSQGVIIWFPSQPYYDEDSQMWIGENGVNITSCIADPWPSDGGGKYANTQIVQEQNSYVSR